jgi:hypothetical protein
VRQLAVAICRAVGHAPVGHPATMLRRRSWSSDLRDGQILEADGALDAGLWAGISRRRAGSGLVPDRRARRGFPVAGGSVVEEVTLMRRFVALGALFMSVIVLSLAMSAANAGVSRRPISDFVLAQGQLLDINGDHVYTPAVFPTGDLFVPPVPNLIGWWAARDEIFAWIDYAGVADAWIVANGGVSLGTTCIGTITERPLKDGRAEVNVNLHVYNALTWAFSTADYGWDFVGAPCMFGARAPDVLAGATPGIGDAHIVVKIINSAPGAPLPDLVAFWNADPSLQPYYPGVEVPYLNVKATAFGPLADGSGGKCTIVQTAIMGVPGVPGRDYWPAERVTVKPVGR